MALSASISKNIPAQTEEITFSNPSVLDSITYSASGITYPIAASFTLSQSDLQLFLQYKQQYYNALLQDFPSLNPFFTAQLPFNNANVFYAPGPNFLNYFQTSKNPALPVYSLSIHKGTKVTTFVARASAITITYQEFLFNFPIFMNYLNKCVQE